MLPKNKLRNELRNFTKGKICTRRKNKLKPFEEKAKKEKKKKKKKRKEKL